MQEHLAQISIYSKLESHSGPCLIDKSGNVLEYSQMKEICLTFRNQLANMKIVPGSVFGIVLPNGINMAKCFLALANYVKAAPLNPNYTEEEFIFYLEDLECKYVVTDESVSDNLKNAAKKTNTKLLFIETDEVSNSLKLKSIDATKNLAFKPNFNNDQCLILHTSGTTSKPKQVQLSTKNILSSASNIANTLHLSKADTGLNIMPLFHIHGLIASLLSSVFSGGCLVCTEGFNALSFFSQVKTFKPTWITAVPTMYQALLGRSSRNSSIIKSSEIRFLRSSSAAMPVKTIEELETVFECPLIEAYGMTEALHQMASNPLNGIRKSGSVGKAAGPKIALLKDLKIYTESGTEGEIIIKGENVTKGYKNNDLANKESFVEGWFRTGDLGTFDQEGFLFISGRIKEIINKGGEKISPKEIDEALMKHPAVFQAVTFSITHDKLGEDVGAAIVLKEDKSVSKEEIQLHLKNIISNFKIPKTILFLNEIPKGNTGKIQRIGLAKKLGIEK